jgi:Na+-transporting methylmalonyl-CoA/oxaloacetate decarboxylase gamma subunit
MGVDWGFAAQVGGTGFVMVFVLLIILAVIIWLTGRLANKTLSTNNKNDDNQKGA